ncbi:ABC-2 type transport system permease protein [Kribbella sp. VKM Ac-2569]|uniref:ABC transporter permease n=1 Tax=Kribbella sp. VKM Ac-2569 TaxID=2512220 RepID=UPI00102CB7FF|nr:ABC transporter permease [Kribbella sp. VKM Ac-2569]RZT28116.1 ABC-2 type transport system permease protein [Kribbella sp. VKM Ac-2569]
MKSLAGTGGLIRLILRRDRVVLPLWIVLLVAISVSYVQEYGDLFPTPEARVKYASNAGFITLYGELSGPSLGEFVTWRLGFVPVMVGLISLLTVIRHTRVDEESGRRELLGATVVGRHAQLAAALATVLGANLVLAVLLALGMHSQDLPLSGSIAIGIVYAGTGWLFAAVGAVAAQLTASAGTARGIAIGVLGGAYVLRAAGDTSAHTDGPLAWLSYLSPIAWAQRIHPYADNRWWLGVVVLAATVALITTAFQLAVRRDVGSGLLPDRLGPADGTMGSPLALAWRLHRGLLAAWTVGFALLGLLFGGVAEGVGDMMRDDPSVQEMFRRMGGAAGLIDSFLAGVMTLVGLIASAYAVQATLRMRVEESSGRAEPVLATATSRWQWAASHLVFSLLGPAVALLAAGVAEGLAYGVAIGDVGGQLPRLIGAALAQLPAVWVLAAIAIAIFGFFPQASMASWAGPTVCILIGLVSAGVSTAGWIRDISPFTHLPSLPGGSAQAGPFLVLLGIAIVVGLAGLVGLRRRDLPA